MPAARASRRTSRKTAWRSSRPPVAVANSGPSSWSTGRPAVAAREARYRSSTPAVPGARARRRGLPLLPVKRTVRCPRSCPTSSMSSPTSSPTRSPRSASRVRAAWLRSAAGPWSRPAAASSASTSAAVSPTVPEWSRPMRGRSAPATGLAGTAPTLTRNAYQLDSPDSRRATVAGVSTRPDRLSTVDSRSRAYVVTCRKGARSGSTCRLAHQDRNAATSRRYAARVCSDSRRLASHASVNAVRPPEAASPPPFVGTNSPDTGIRGCTTLCSTSVMSPHPENVPFEVPLELAVGEAGELRVELALELPVELAVEVAVEPRLGHPLGDRLRDPFGTAVHLDAYRRLRPADVVARRHHVRDVGEQRPGRRRERPRRVDRDQSGQPAVVVVAGQHAGAGDVP